MKVEYFVPSRDRRLGGIDLAIDGMRDALASRHEIATKQSGVPEEDTQLVHFHGLWEANHLTAYRACQRKNLPYLISPHGMLEPWAYRNHSWKKWPWMKLFGQGHLDQAATVLATSQMESDNLQRFAKRTQIAPLGLVEELPMTRAQARHELGIADDKRVVLYLSRLDRKKGLDLLVEAMRDQPEFELWVVGDGDRAFASELKSSGSENVRWFGPDWGTGRWKYLIAADLFCLPTHSENFGFAILEALWAGTPTLTTTKTPWVEHESVDGLHICEDTLESLQAALDEILPGLDRPAKLREWAREHFHWDRLTDTYDQIYLNAVMP